MQVPYYNVHKIMQGLLDQNQLLGNTQAFQMLLKMATYFNNRITTLIKTNGTAVWEEVRKRFLAQFLDMFACVPGSISERLF